MANKARAASVPYMRTTIDLDDDVLLEVNQRARAEHRSAGQVLSELARAALTATTPTAQSFFGFRPLPPRAALPATNERVEEIRDSEGL